MWGEESGRIKDNFQVSALNSEWTVMTMRQGRTGGGRGGGGRGQAGGTPIWKFKKKTERPILDL